MVFYCGGGGVGLGMTIIWCRVVVVGPGRLGYRSPKLYTLIIVILLVYIVTFIRSPSETKKIVKTRPPTDVYFQIILVVCKSDSTKLIYCVSPCSMLQ